MASLTFSLDADDLAEFRALVERAEAAADRIERASGQMTISVHPGAYVTTRDDVARDIADAVERSARRHR